jgi:predicted dehydrogenase
MSIRTAILGTGWGARIQAPAFSHAGLEVKAIWGRTDAKAEAAARRHDIPLYASDWRKIVHHPEIDLVSIVTPPHTHHEIAIAALAAGKHVLCEKPMALNAAEAQEMTVAAEAAGKQLALIDHELRFVPLRRKMREMLRAGWHGELLHLSATIESGWRLDPGRRWDWWSQAERGGGILGALGSHVVDSFRWLTGLEIEAVSAVARPLIAERPDAEGNPQPVTADEYAALLLRLSNGASGLIELTAGAPGKEVTRLVVAGTQGKLTYDGSSLIGERAGARPLPIEVRDPTKLPPGLVDSEWSRGTMHFARSLRLTLSTQGRSPIEGAATFADGLATQRVLDAALESSRLGPWGEGGGEGGGWVSSG